MPCKRQGTWAARSVAAAKYPEPSVHVSVRLSSLIAARLHRTRFKDVGSGQPGRQVDQRVPCTPPFLDVEAPPGACASAFTSAPRLCAVPRLATGPTATMPQAGARARVTHLGKEYDRYMHGRPDMWRGLRTLMPPSALLNMGWDERPGARCRSSLSG